MIIAFDAHAKLKRDASHRACRRHVQSAGGDASEHATYYELITELVKLTGVPVFLITSFPIKGEPIMSRRPRCILLP